MHRIILVSSSVMVCLMTGICLIGMFANPTKLMIFLVLLIYFCWTAFTFIVLWVTLYQLYQFTDKTIAQIESKREVELRSHRIASVAFEASSPQHQPVISPQESPLGEVDGQFNLRVPSTLRYKTYGILILISLIILVSE